MYITITCSRCGKHRRISNKLFKYTIDVTDQGWSSFGSALYCPECARTWHERNTTYLASESETRAIISNLFWREERSRHGRKA